MGHEKGRGAAQRITALLLALAVWELAVRIVDNRLLLVGPIATVKCLISLMSESAFWLAALSSSGRIMLGFALALLTALPLSALAARFPLAETLLRPYIAAIQSVPVASFIVIALLWLSSARLSVFIAFLMVLPMLYQSLLTGLRSADRELIEMARVFRMSRLNKIRSIYIPAAEQYLLSAASTALGVCWKAGVAAELIGVASSSIGGRLYEAKVSLDIPALFAWTLVTVALSAVFGRLALLALGKCIRLAEGV